MASFRKRGPYRWQARVRKKAPPAHLYNPRHLHALSGGHPLQIKTFETRAEVEQWARATEVERDKGAFVARAEVESNNLEELLERYLVEVRSGRWRTYGGAPTPELAALPAGNSNSNSNMIVSLRGRPLFQTGRPRRRVHQQPRKRFGPFATARCR